MFTHKKFNVIGIMSGTSMDGLDLSFLKTNGVKDVKIIKEKSYIYSNLYKKKLKKIIFQANKKSIKEQVIFLYKNENHITSEIISIIKKFLSTIDIKDKIDLIGFSGQTVLHNPKKKITIQLGSCKKIYEKFNIPVIGNFRKNDINSGGQGAPIGSYYHKFIINKFKKKTAVINLGGISNITYLMKKKLISFDLGPANLLIDDLSYFFYKKQYDKFGNIAKKGKIIKEILDVYCKDSYFKKKPPKSLDREYFNRYKSLLEKYLSKDAIHTASIMTVVAILIGLRKIDNNIIRILLTGGGRKNKFIYNELSKKLPKIKVELIDKYNFNGDLLEAQMFGYLAVRSLKKLTISNPYTTGAYKAVTGGEIFGKF